MIRILGAITGSALALAALLVFVGVPQFKAAPSDIAPAVVTLPLRVTPVDDRPEEAAAAPVVEPMEVAADAVVEEPIEVAAEEAVQEPIEAAAQESAEDAVAMSFEELPLPQPGTQQWYAFWSPFRSEIAASGFVTQLQRVTALDYRVVKLKPGVYEVAFAYAADVDIPDNLSQISAATGLDMPGN